MGISKILVPVMALSVALSACAFAAPTAPVKATAPAFNQQAALDKLWSAPDDAVVGTVGNVKVTKGELMRKLWYWNAPSALQDILSQKMIESAAKKVGVTLSPKDVTAKIQETVVKMKAKDVNALLAQYRVTKVRFTDGIRVNTLAEKAVQKGTKITDKDYAQWIQARHILIKFPADEKDKAKAEATAKAKIDEIAAKANAGNFAELATQNSEDPGSKEKGGDLGWFSKGRMVKEFEDSAFSLKPGEISQPVKTYYGYHIIYVQKTGATGTPADKAEIKKLIQEKNASSQLGEWFNKLQSTTKMDNMLMGPVVTPPAPKPPTQPRPQIQVKPQTQTPAPAPAPADPKTETPPPPPAR